MRAVTSGSSPHTASIAGNVTVVALDVFHLEELACTPRIAIPHKQLKYIVTTDVVILVRPQNLVRAAWQVKSQFSLLSKILWQTVKQG